MSSPREVRPTGRAVDATVSPPGSKSLTIRALATAALAEGRSHLYGALQSADTVAMTRCLGDLGVGVKQEADPWTVDGIGGHVESPGGPLDAVESALSARILTAMAALGHGEIVVDGSGSLRRRPMLGLVQALAAWGVEVRSEGTIPVTVSGRGGIFGGPVSVDALVSSQFATALLLVAPVAETVSEVRVDGLRGSRGYLDLTVGVMRDFDATVTPTITGYTVDPNGYRPTDFVVEPDASAAVYPMLAAAITGGRVEITALSLDSAQPDIAIAGVLEEMGCRVAQSGTGLVVEGPTGSLRSYHGDLSRCPDGALVVAVAAMFADGVSELSGLGSLRHKESDRIDSLATEIGRLGAGATVDGDTLRISPSRIVPATVDPHGDHRIAMAFAPIGLVVDGIEVADPDVVDKTWPGFWAMLDGLTV